MTFGTDLDELRHNALERIDRSERAFRGWVIAAGVVEAAGLIAFILLADFSDRTHLLLLVAALLIYGTLAMGIIALGAFIRVGLLRVVKAIEVCTGAEEA